MTVTDHMTRDGDVLGAYRRHVSSGLAKLAGMISAPVISRAEGSYAYSSAGERFLDCGGYSIFLLGHSYPPVVEAAVSQLRTMALTGPMVFHAELARAAETLAGICPDGLDHVYLTNSGAEAVETALKLARANGRRHMIATESGFHGKTLGALSVTGRAAYRAPFEPLAVAVDFVPYGDAEAVTARLTPASCVIVEPVQGEGGVRIPPRGYLTEVAEACRRAGALLIVDEIQTGLGRVGHLWAVNDEGVVPDLLLSGKALGGGVVPVGAVIATAEVFAPLSRDPFLHTSTFGGNPLAATVVRRTIKEVLRNDVPGRARRLEGRLRELLASALRGCAHLVREVRGRGVLFGIEFVDPSHAGELVIELIERRVLVSSSATALATVRLTPSAFVEEPELAWLHRALTGAAAALGQRHRTS